MNVAKFLTAAYITHSSYFITEDVFTVHEWMRVSIKSVCLTLTCIIVCDDHFLLCFRVQNGSKYHEKFGYSHTHGTSSSQIKYYWPILALHQAQTLHSTKKLDDRNGLWFRRLVQPFLSHFEAWRKRPSYCRDRQGNLRIQRSNKPIPECTPAQLASFLLTWAVRGIPRWNLAAGKFTGFKTGFTTLS